MCLLLQDREATCSKIMFSASSFNEDIVGDQGMPNLLLGEKRIQGLNKGCPWQIFQFPPNLPTLESSIPTHTPQRQPFSALHKYWAEFITSRPHALFDECVMEGPAIRALIAAAVPWLVIDPRNPFATPTHPSLPLFCFTLARIFCTVRSTRPAYVGGYSYLSDW